MPIIDQFGFNLILRILITIYWATGIWNFLARTADPRINDDAEIFRLNKRNYIFWLVTSLIFFFFWISEFENQTLVYLTVIEIVILIIIYTYLMIMGAIKNSRQMKKIKEMKQEKLERLRKWY
jgi:RsiW-degrading membrane proteinase PrsW (M82 family)